ncbi:MAG: hypothetical protein K6G69_03955 [Lachnospiraceae bacterium]|nr:hypothetical protein [Lachnospiraceae bacterium]
MIIISGPSTIGKNPFIEYFTKEKSYSFLVPCTTRKPRSEEKNAIDYYFYGVDEFQNLIKHDVIDQWDYCLGNYYGYERLGDNLNSKKIITHGLSRMAIRIKKQFPNDVVTVFFKPKDSQMIFSRLKKIYDGEMLCLRQALVKEELSHSVLFDYVIECNENAKEEYVKKEFNKIITGLDL